MKSNPLIELEKLGQSIWVDFISREMIQSGELQRLINEDGVSGVTSNPSIFEKAIVGSHDYDDLIQSMALVGKSIDQIYQTLTTEDIQSAADLFRPMYDRLQGADGYVSLEVSPRLAHDTSGTIAEAHLLWSAVKRPNVMIKVPGTREGIPAVRQLVSDGINVNITLLFGIPRYQQIAEAYIAGLEDRAAKGLPLNNIASVASFFLSRIDVMIDPLLENEMHVDDPDVEIAASLKGQAAIASAKIAYRTYKNIFFSERFRKLSSLGARSQRLLWASTSTKNPAYSDVRYVEPLIGHDTINTLTTETISAYREQGNPRSTLSEGTAEADSQLEQLKHLGFDIERVTQRLEDEGVQKFLNALDILMNALKQKRDESLKETVGR